MSPSFDDRELKGTARVLFKGLAESYDRSLDYASLFQDRVWKNWIIERMEPRTSQKVLDVGCGTCIFEKLLEPFGCQVLALDLTEEMIRVGQARAGRHGMGLVLGDAEALPFSDSAFDTVISAYVVKYCDPSRFVHELARVTKPGGRLLFYDFVRPQGPFSPALSFYVYGILKVAREIVAPVNGGVAYTLGNLPRIIRETTWNLEVAGHLESLSLAIAERKALGGGIVEAFVCLKGLGRGEQPELLESQPPRRRGFGPLLS